MVHLPQVVSKHILSLKDPRYERVMNGNPYMATPTRVFVVEREEWRRYKRDGAPLVDRIQFRNIRNNEISEVSYCVFSLNEVDHGLRLSPLWHIKCLEAKLHPKPDSNDPGAAIKCSYKATEMSMQCEVCGPDLELYQRRR